MELFIAGCVTSALFLSIMAAALSERPGEKEQERLRARGLAGQVFLVERATEPWLRCACLDGTPASLEVYGGKKASGVCCVRCARSELTNWLLHQHETSKPATKSKIPAAI